MVTNMCVKFGEDWTNSFQELDRKQSSGHTHGQGQPYMPPLCGVINRCYMCIQWTSVLYFIVITCQSNPPIQQTVWCIQQWSMFPCYTMHTANQLTSSLSYSMSRFLVA